MLGNCGAIYLIINIPSNRLFHHFIAHIIDSRHSITIEETKSTLDRIFVIIQAYYSGNYGVLNRHVIRRWSYSQKAKLKSIYYLYQG